MGRDSFASDENYHDGRRSTIKKKSRKVPAQINRDILGVPPAGGWIFFAENDRPGGNSKVGGDLKKYVKNTPGEKSPGGSSEKYSSHTSHTPQLPRCRV